MRSVEYAKAINASDEIINWLSTTGKKAQITHRASDQNIEHIIDWMTVTNREKCRKLSYKDAKRLADEWSLQQQKIKAEKENDSDTEILIDFKDGFLFKKLLTKKAFKNEGSLMSHCLGGYNPDNKDVDIFSLRDKKNKPHCTIEVRKNNKEIVQIKGKGNGSIHPDYINYVLTFFEKIDFKIRKEEMKNLGYYFVYDEHLDFVKKNLGKAEKLVRVKDINYVY